MSTAIFRPAPAKASTIMSVDASSRRLSTLCSSLGALAGSVGLPTFFDRLLESLRPIVAFSNSDLVIVDLVSSDAPPLLVGVQCAKGRYSNVIRERYLSSGYHFCPEIAAIRTGRVNDIFSMSDLGMSSFLEPACYDTYYGLLELRNFYDIFADIGDGRVAGWSIGRHVSDADFDRADDRRIRCLAPVLIGLLARHCQLAYPERPLLAAPNATFRSQVLDILATVAIEPLTDRESEVALLMARGFSTKATSNVLGISPLTESVHRRNLFRKLNMASQVEVVSFCLEHLLGGNQHR